MTVRDAYEWLYKVIAPIYDSREASTISRYLIEDLFCTTFWSENDLTPAQLAQWQTTAQRLQNHEPWQYIGGLADFYGMKFHVSPAVLIPRPETEELVYLALQMISKHQINSILDIGCGSGIIPITIRKKMNSVQVYGLDISEDALQVSKGNALLHQVPVQWIQEDIMDKSKWPDLPTVDMVISNPPYITHDEKKVMNPNVLNHEPHLALFVNNDAMEFYTAISSFVINHQGYGCHILVEINENYGKEVCHVFHDAGLKNVVLIYDLQDKPRFVSAQKSR